MRQATLTLPAEELSRFEAIYAEAELAGDAGKIPWDHGRANPALVAWMDRIAPGKVRCGCRVAVVGCGLGHDARELIRRGFEVTAFDICQTAVRWAKRLDPENAQCYFRADLLDPPARWVHRFELVVEVHTLQAVPPEYRPTIMEGIARLVGMNGTLLAITRAATEPVTAESGPPWPITESELRELAAGAGLQVESLECFEAGDPPAKRIRAALERA